MKVIDLLNKIANGEEVPEKIKIETHIFTRFDYIKGDGTYISSYQSDDAQYFIHDYSYPKDLNREVEIIEEHKIPEKIFLEDMYSANEIKVIDIELENKINEILDYLEKINEE